MRQRVFFCKKTGLLIVRSLKSSYWPRPVEGQERTGFRPPPLGVVGRWEARVGHSLQSNSPEEQLHPAPAQLRSTWVTALTNTNTNTNSNTACKATHRRSNCTLQPNSGQLGSPPLSGGGRPNSVIFHSLTKNGTYSIPFSFVLERGRWRSLTEVDEGEEGDDVDEVDEGNHIVL